MHSINTVDAHNEKDTIIGNFTGTSIDTLYVDKIVGQNDEKYKITEFFLRSTNIKIPSIELYGYADVPPKLVNEGDLDGNGTSEVGYLHTWMNSQWRYYRILTLVNNEWRYLIDGDYLDTPEWFRHAGVEIAEPVSLFFMYIVKPADKIPTIIGTNNESKNFMMFSTLISIFINYFLIRKINITS